jgi:hypothetical protein
LITVTRDHPADMTSSGHPTIARFDDSTTRSPERPYRNRQPAQTGNRSYDAGYLIRDRQLCEDGCSDQSRSY